MADSYCRTLPIGFFSMYATLVYFLFFLFFNSFLLLYMHFSVDSGGCVILFGGFYLPPFPFGILCHNGPQLYQDENAPRTPSHGY